MRKRARVDSNQTEIVKTFRILGCSVLHLHTVGNGCPDILIARFGINVLVEIKDGDKIKSKRKLTEDEKKFSEAWKGELEIIENKSDAIKLVEKLNNEFKKRMAQKIQGKVDRQKMP